MIKELLSTISSAIYLTVSREGIFLIYLFLINVIGFALVIIDKQKAIQRKWRIPERIFFIFAFLGAGVGEFLTMVIIRHKTKHWLFMVGIPIITIAFYWVLFYLMYR